MFDITISKTLSLRQGGIFTLRTSIVTSNKRVVLFGPSGSGKSLTLQSIAGLVSPDAGHIRIAGRTLFESSRKTNLLPRHRNVGVIFQNYALFPHLSVRDNVAFGLKKLWRRLTDEENKRVSELLHIFGLIRVQHSRPDEISGGQQQRCALARGLAVNPALLLLDEPFSALDIPLRKRMYKEVATTLREFEIPLVLVTHDPAEVEYFGDTVVEFDNGGGSVVDCSNLRSMDACVMLERVCAV